jgi:hypothetical protein
MDVNKPKTSDEEGAQPPALLAGSPYRPLSRRRRQALSGEPRSAVERPAASVVFTASPATIAAAVAKNGVGPEPAAAFVWPRTATEAAAAGIAAAEAAAGVAAAQDAAAEIAGSEPATGSSDAPGK